MKSSVARSVHHWQEYRGGQFGASDWLIEHRKDEPSPSSSSSFIDATSAAASMTSSRAQISALLSNGGDLYRKHVLGLKKCFHCPHCRYSTDRKNNLKRHLGTMHRHDAQNFDLQVDQPSHHVAASCHSCVEHCSFDPTQFARRHDDVAMTDSPRTDDATRHGETEPPLHSATAQSDDVSTICANEAGTPSLPAAAVVSDSRCSLPRFEPRPAAAYCRHSSRMFFYDRLRCTHDYTDDDDAQSADSCN